ncbi:MAG TPA: FliM/FliN family flagellar motor switch protein [Terriglobia bacterium]|nr:FliM/FliN family flagellar motor switch protein [Terriglobia bacterium]
MDTSVNKDESREELGGNLALLLDVQLPVAIRFGETEMILEEVVKLGVGSVIELNSGMDQPVELVVNNRILARGEVVTVDGFYGIKITEITSAGERFKSLST